MKYLCLVRHAKSDWSNESLQDIYRYLTERGYHDAELMSERVIEKQIQPDCIITSPAIRAYSTALVFANALNYSTDKIVLAPTLYEAKASEVLALVSALNDELNTVLLVGHNPSFTDLTNLLLTSAIDNLTTAGVVAIRLNSTTWKNAATASADLLFIDYPKLLR